MKILPLLLIFLIIPLTSAIPLVQYTQFNDSSTSQSFITSAYNNTVYLILPYSSNVSSSQINLTGHSSSIGTETSWQFANPYYSFTLGRDAIYTNGTSFWLGGPASDSLHELSEFYVNGTFKNKHFFSGIFPDIYDVYVNGSTYYILDGIEGTESLYEYANKGFIDVNKINLSYVKTVINFTETLGGSHNTWSFVPVNNYFYILRANQSDTLDPVIYQFWQNGTYTGNNWNIATSLKQARGTIRYDGTYFWISNTTSLAKYYDNFTFIESYPLVTAYDIQNKYIYTYSLGTVKERLFHNGFPNSVKIDTGNDGIFDYINNTLYNSSELIDLNNTALNSFLQSCSYNSNKNCNVPIKFSVLYPGNLSLNDLSVNLTLPISKMSPTSYITEDSAWGPLTNNTYTNSTYIVYLNITKAGVNNLTKTLFINLTKDIFTNNDYTLIGVYNTSNQNISSYTFTGGLLKYTLENITTLGTHYNTIKVEVNNALHYMYKSAVGGGYYYQIKPNFTVYGTPAQYALISLPLSEQVLSSDYHPVYWVCLNPTSDFTCGAWSLGVSVTESNNGNNSISGYPVNLKYYTTNGKFTQISFQANFSSPFLLQVVFSAGAATSAGTSSTPVVGGGGGGGGAGYTEEVEQIVNQTLLEHKTCPQGYYLSKDKTKCIPLKTKIEEFEDELLKPRWTIGKWSFGIFSAGLLLVALWAFKGVLSKK